MSMVIDRITTAAELEKVLAPLWKKRGDLEERLRAARVDVEITARDLDMQADALLAKNSFR